MSPTFIAAPYMLRFLQNGFSILANSYSNHYPGARPQSPVDGPSACSKFRTSFPDRLQTYEAVEG